LTGTPTDPLFASGQGDWPHNTSLTAGKDRLQKTMSKRLFVGNLSFDTSEADLNAAFSQWGGEGATIPTNESGRPKGFGFVEVAADQSNAAIAAMNGKEVAGRALTVNEARPREDRGGYGGNRGGYGGGRSDYGGGGGGGGRRW
jgi:RNA recognition motif-containing protein